MEKLLHTPEGVRDIYNVECGKKLTLESRLKKTLHLFGYHDIQTPTFEYFDVFRKEIGTIPSKELYKFFDKEGNTLALRPDITPSVARAAATLFGEEKLPIRLCYTGNTFVNHSSYQGRLREATQLGAELIGDDSVEADAEMLKLAKRMGIPKDCFIASITDSGAFSYQFMNTASGTFDENFENPVFTVNLAFKDIRLGVEMAEKISQIGRAHV